MSQNVVLVFFILLMAHILLSVWSPYFPYNQMDIDYVTQRAIQEQDSSICKRMMPHVFVLTTFGMFSPANSLMSPEDLCYTNYANASGDIDSCNELTSLFDRHICFRQYAISHLSINACDKIADLQRSHGKPGSDAMRWSDECTDEILRIRFSISNANQIHEI